MSFGLSLKAIEICRDHYPPSGRGCRTCPIRVECKTGDPTSGGDELIRWRDAVNTAAESFNHEG